MKEAYIIIFLFFIFYSCDSSKTYKKHSSGLEYRILKKAPDSSAQIKEGDIVELKLKYYTDKDSLIFNSNEFTGSFKIKVKPISHEGGSFEQALQIMKVGERYEFLISAFSFFTKTQGVRIPKNINPKSKLRFDIELTKLVSEEEISRERELQNKQMQRQENNLLAQYILDNQIEQKPTQSGLYIIETKKGKGKKPIKGDSLSVHYIGKLINGQVFDSSYDRNEEFKFALGDSTIIKGWNEGFAHLKQNSEATFIIPSKLAYGKKGFSTIIPPFSSLIFEVKLIKIN